jgi:hypothetical protein
VRALPFAAAAVCALAALAGCGSTGDGVSMADAKRDVVIACRQGAADALDAKLCRCIADEAATKPQYDTPQELLALADQQTNAKLPPVLDAIVTSCARRYA